MVKTTMAAICDPRPDLYEDSALWSLVLGVAHETNSQLAVNLYGFRCDGTRLKRSRKWGLVMEPILPGDEIKIDVGNGGDGGDGTGKITTKTTTKAVFGHETGWRDREDYRAMTREYLQPYHRELVGLFKRFG